MTHSTPSRPCGYRNDVGNGWLLDRSVRCFANFVRNLNAPVTDPDFFDIVAESRFGEESAFLSVLLRHCSPKALEKEGLAEPASCGLLTADVFDENALEDLAKPRTRSHRRAPAIKNLASSVSGVLVRLWNRKPLRKACRAVLADIAGALLADAAKEAARAEDPMAARFAEIVAFLRLDPISSDILAFAAVHAWSQFRDYPVRVRTLSKLTDFFAMALDRPLGEVSRALRADAPLRRFEILDDDCDLANGPFRDYLENGSDTLLEGRFYKRTPVDDALPLSFHGDIAARHAPIIKTLLSSAAASAHAPSILFYPDFPRSREKQWYFPRICPQVSTTSACGTGEVALPRCGA
ncbi:MAG: hypothetical protein IK066_00380, partial [Kiritimatiellae bacterium]|nr:hypothetical protein [Kiritimatiellia bacterium]